MVQLSFCLFLYVFIKLHVINFNEELNNTFPITNPAVPKVHFWHQKVGATDTGFQNPLVSMVSPNKRCYFNTRSMRYCFDFNGAIILRYGLAGFDNYTKKLQAIAMYVHVQYGRPAHKP